MNKLNLTVVILSLLFANTFALTDQEIEYYRNQGFYVIENSFPSTVTHGVYLVTNDLEIAPGERVEVEPGTLILFMKNAALKVKGTLICRATPRSTVTFSSLPAQSYKEPVSNDDEVMWRGIKAFENSTIDIRYCNINGALVGVELTSQNLSFESEMVNFRYNFLNLVVSDVIAPVKDGQFTSVSLGPDDIPDYIASIEDYKYATDVFDLFAVEEQKRNRRSKLRRVSIISATTGAAITAASFAAFGYFNNQYNNSTDRSKFSPSQVDLYERRRQQSFDAGLASAVFTAVAVSMIFFTIEY
ncbi:hypothetical protein QA601_05760 [Chitinispirillales bacterium ANBcel5]|uniref:hypothetical protein n=1 Tax=Cellulosispirillum alkaliphilum TaxID=3039283 RepID=UPI002A51B5FF|nr:hypothetical protein [Chitinispirillales bacterium ANBcel5]